MNRYKKHETIIIIRIYNGRHQTSWHSGNTGSNLGHKIVFLYAYMQANFHTHPNHDIRCHDLGGISFSILMECHCISFLWQLANAANWRHQMSWLPGIRVFYLKYSVVVCIFLSPPYCSFLQLLQKNQLSNTANSRQNMSWLWGIRYVLPFTALKKCVKHSKPMTSDVATMKALVFRIKWKPKQAFYVSF